MHWLRRLAEQRLSEGESRKAGMRGRGLVRALPGVVVVLGFSVSLSAHADPLLRVERMSSAESRGEIIYTRGETPSGGTLFFRLASGNEVLPARGIACAGCHGNDGRGRREGDVAAPDITPEALSKPATGSPPSRRSRSRAPYSDGLLARAITSGVDSSGNRLNPLMPRWSLSAPELRDLLSYMKRLGREQERALRWDPR
jgi:Cytochrome c